MLLDKMKKQEFRKKKKIIKINTDKKTVNDIKIK